MHQSHGGDDREGEEETGGDGAKVNPISIFGQIYQGGSIKGIPLLLPPFLLSPFSLSPPPSLSYPILLYFAQAYQRCSNEGKLPHSSHLPSPFYPSYFATFLPPSLPPPYSLPLLCIKSTLAVLVKAIKGGSLFLPSSPPLYSFLSPSPFLSFSFSFSSSSPLFSSSPLLFLSSSLPPLLN